MQESKQRCVGQVKSKVVGTVVLSREGGDLQKTNRMFVRLVIRRREAQGQQKRRRAASKKEGDK